MVCVVRSTRNQPRCLDSSSLRSSTASPHLVRWLTSSRRNTSRNLFRYLLNGSTTTFAVFTTRELVDAIQFYGFQVSGTSRALIICAIRIMLAYISTCYMHFKCFSTAFGNTDSDYRSFLKLLQVSTHAVILPMELYLVPSYHLFSHH